MTCKRANRTIKTAPGEPVLLICCATLTREDISATHRRAGGCIERKWSPGAGEASQSRWSPQRRLQKLLALRGCPFPASKQAGSVTCSGAFKAAEAIVTCEAWTRTTTMQRRREILMPGGREAGGGSDPVESPITRGSTLTVLALQTIGHMGRSGLWDNSPAPEPPHVIDSRTRKSLPCPEVPTPRAALPITEPVISRDLAQK